MNRKGYVDWEALAAIVVVIAFIAAATIVGGITGYRDGCHSTEREAVKAGVATYTADENGKPAFTWKYATTQPVEVSR